MCILYQTFYKLLVYSQAGYSAQQQPCCYLKKKKIIIKSADVVLCNSMHFQTEEEFAVFS